MTIKQALISVDKTASESAQGLAAEGVKLLSTGGPPRRRRDAGLAVTEIGDYTLPGNVDGRRQDPAPEGARWYLARRDLAEHMATIDQYMQFDHRSGCVNLDPLRRPNSHRQGRRDAGTRISEHPHLAAGHGPLGQNYNGARHRHHPARLRPLARRDEGRTAGALALVIRFNLAKKAFHAVLPVISTA